MNKGFKTGDSAKVLFAVPSKHFGWAKDWASGMNGYVGYTGKAIDTHAKNGVQLKFNDGAVAWFPAYALEIVKKENVKAVKAAFNSKIDVILKNVLYIKDKMAKVEDDKEFVNLKADMFLAMLGFPFDTATCPYCNEFYSLSCDGCGYKEEKGKACIDKGSRYAKVMAKVAELKEAIETEYKM